MWARSISLSRITGDLGGGLVTYRHSPPGLGFVTCLALLGYMEAMRPGSTPDSPDSSSYGCLEPELFTPQLFIERMKIEFKGGGSCRPKAPQP